MRCVRIWFAKEGKVKYISHLDVMRCMSRAVRRARLPLWYTEGFSDDDTDKSAVIRHASVPYFKNLDGMGQEVRRVVEKYFTEPATDDHA